MKKIYFDVPYEEKDAAKLLGAKWDNTHKSWYCYIPENIHTLYSRWMPLSLNEEKKEYTNLESNLEFQNRFQFSFQENFFHLIKQYDENLKFNQRDQIALQNAQKLFNSVKDISDLLYDDRNLETLYTSLSDHKTKTKGIEIMSDLIAAGTIDISTTHDVKYSPKFVKEWIKTCESVKLFKDFVTATTEVENDSSILIHYEELYSLYLLEDFSFLTCKHNLATLIVDDFPYELINDRIPVPISYDTLDIDEPNYLLNMIFNQNLSETD